MGGGSGGTIVRSAVKQGLTDPVVHGQLPPATCAVIDAILAKDEGTWDKHEVNHIAKAVEWALKNLT